MVEWFLGTIGLAYPEWKGNFYPVGLPSGQVLNYYSKIFNAVEINTTFYGPQSLAQIQRWAASTPDDFRFCLKAPKRVTHELRLKDAGAEMLAFVEPSAGLDEKFAPILIQLPPSLKVDETPTLADFLKTLPAGPRYAIEFRHSSWHVPQTADLLRAHGVCWVSNDFEDLPVEIRPTTDFLYIRWIAKHNVIPHPGHEVIDRTERLQTWIDLIHANLDGVHAVYCFFDNDFAGHAPASCNRLKGMLGLPVNTIPAEQGRLF